MNKIIRLFFITTIFPLLLLLSCQDNHIEKIDLDFSKNDSTSSVEYENDESIKVAIAAMTGPEDSYKYYRDLIQYIENITGENVTIVQRKTYQEVNDLLSKKRVDLAFVCSGGYIEARKRNEAEILVVPVINDKITYQSYLIVSKDAPYNSISDLKGKTFAFTDPMSNTGCLYPKWMISELGFTPEEFFSNSFYTHSHDKAIQAVAHGIADGASVDGLIFDYLKNNGSFITSKVKIIEKSQEFGIPPVVVPVEMDTKLKKKLKKILIEMNLNADGLQILNHLGIDKFSPGNDTMYHSIRNISSM